MEKNLDGKFGQENGKERLKLSNLARGTRGLQPERDGRAGCSELDKAQMIKICIQVKEFCACPFQVS